MVNDESLDLWVVEYSSIQKHFHIHQLQDAIRKNAKMFLDDNTEMNGYMPIAICNTWDEATEVCNKLREYRDTQANKELAHALPSGA